MLYGRMKIDDSEHMLEISAGYFLCISLTSPSGVLGQAASISIAAI
jgi:hypothetical protein